MVKHRIAQELHPPYSLDLALWNFFSFSKQKFITRVKFEQMEDIKRNMQKGVSEVLLAMVKLEDIKRNMTVQLYTILKIEILEVLWPMKNSLE